MSLGLLWLLSLVLLVLMGYLTCMPGPCFLIVCLALASCLFVLPCSRTLLHTVVINPSAGACAGDGNKGLDHVCSQPTGVVSHRKRTLVWRRDMCSTIVSPTPPLTPHHRTSKHARAVPTPPPPMFCPLCNVAPLPSLEIAPGSHSRKGVH